VYENKEHTKYYSITVMHDLQVYWPRLKGSCQYSQCTAESWGRTWEQGYRWTI